MTSLFYESSQKVLLRPSEGAPNSGFRLGQFGALHALIAHFTTSEDPAIICLPTGYGKTAVITAVPFLLRSTRVLVIEPTNVLRKQVAAAFQELATLRKIGSLDGSTPNPKVLVHDSRPTCTAEWDSLRQYDVVVSTPNSSSPSLNIGMPTDLFDLVIFDEAHHVPADSWAAYIEHLSGTTKFVFLSATPFRRDGRLLPGRSIYRYSVAAAARENVFGKITYKNAPVTDPFDDEHIDRVIAQTAIQQLGSDRLDGFDHRLFARTSSIARARKLAALYSELGLAVAAVDSHISKRTQERLETELISGELQGIVCVDMFGEGYDFPKLKVAALHSPHKSLVPTIQFIGRFARVDSSTGNGTLISSRGRMQQASLEIIQEGVELSGLIESASLAQITRSESQIAVLEKLPLRRQFESNYDSVSPLSLELYAHIRVFHCSTPPIFSLLKETITRSMRCVKQWVSADDTSCLMLTYDEDPPSWATSPVLVNLRHDVFLFIFKPDTNHCFIGSTRRTEKLYLSLMETVCPGGHQPLSYQETSRARVGLSGMRFFNVGLRNTAFNSTAESYRVVTGPRAEGGFTEGDGRAFSQGHFFGSGMTGEEKETIGASSSSRIWSNKNLTVSEFFDWVDSIDGRIANGEPLAQSNLDKIRSSKALVRLPETIIAGVWPKTAYRTQPKIRFRSDREAPWQYARLCDFELEAFDSRPDDRKMSFSISGETLTVRYLFNHSGGQLFTQEDTRLPIEIQPGVEDWMELSEWLSFNPPIFFSSDRSVFEGMNIIAPPPRCLNAISPDAYRVIHWNDCDIGIEFLLNDGSTQSRQKRVELGTKTTVQEHLEGYLRQLNDLCVLFYDHRSGEAADFIAITHGADGILNVGFYHCKAAGGRPSGSRVGDVYEVAGQMVKSVSYCDYAFLIEHMEYRTSSRHLRPSEFLVGTLEDTKTLLQTTSPVNRTFEIYGVQPGIDHTRIDDHLSDLMAFGIDYTKQGGVANAYWIIS